MWPSAVAPYDVHLIALPGLEEQAAEVAATLETAGDDVLLDDRDRRAGEKFADADLIGLPVRVTVGKRRSTTAPSTCALVGPERKAALRSPS